MHICEHLHRAGVRSEAPRRQRRVRRGGRCSHHHPCHRLPSPSSLINHAKQRPRGIDGAGRRRGSFSPSPCMGRGDTVARGPLTASPRTSRAKARVALKLLHEVMNKTSPALGAAAQPAPRCPPAGETAPSSQQDGAWGYLDLRRRDREMSRNRGLGSTLGISHAQSPRDEVGVPSSSLAALWDAT